VSRNRFLWILIAGVLLSPAACDNVRPVEVSGTVTLDGKPLPSGTVEFQPLSDGQARVAYIEDGEFELPADQGLLPGLEFQVVLKAFRKTGRKYLNRDMSASAEETIQYLPEAYNSRSTLRVTISRDRQENHFRFELKSARP
jgi:hypothetical protein